METIQITIGRVPGSIANLALNEGSTVADALRAAHIDLETGEEVRVGSDSVSPDDPTALEDGDRVFIVKQIKGNQSVITIGRVPGAIQNLAVADGSTVGDALTLANLSPETGEEIRVNNERAEAGQTIHDGDRVFLVKQIKGN